MFQPSPQFMTKCVSLIMISHRPPSLNKSPGLSSSFLCSIFVSFLGVAIVSFLGVAIVSFKSCLRSGAPFANSVLSLVYSKQRFLVKCLVFDLNLASIGFAFPWFGCIVNADTQSPNAPHYGESALTIE